jgi:hypothetical protein
LQGFAKPPESPVNQGIAAILLCTAFHCFPAFFTVTVESDREFLLDQHCQTFRKLSLATFLNCASGTCPEQQGALSLRLALGKCLNSLLKKALFER